MAEIAAIYFDNKPSSCSAEKIKNQLVFEWVKNTNNNCYKFLFKKKINKFKNTEIKQLVAK